MNRVEKELSVWLSRLHLELEARQAEADELGRRIDALAAEVEELEQEGK